MDNIHNKNIPRKHSTYHSVRFHMMGSEDAKKASAVTITEKAFMNNGVPVFNGLYDSKLGTPDFGWRCTTCYNNKTDCLGHNGDAFSNYPLQSPFYRDEILKWLQITCHNCGDFVLQYTKSLALHPKDRILNEFKKKSR